MMRIKIYVALIAAAVVSALAIPTVAIFSTATSFPATNVLGSRGQSGKFTANSARYASRLGRSDHGGYIYVVSDRTSGNQIYGYEVNETTGALTALPGFPVPTGGVGEDAAGSQLIALDQANGRLYAINDGGGSNSLSAFSIDPATGALTALPFSPISLGSGFWLTVAVHPSGSPVIVGDGGSTPSIMSFHVTATTATPAPGSPYIPGTARPFSSEFSVDGNYFYTGGNIGNQFAGYSVNPTTGALTALPGSPYNSGGTFPLGFATDSSARIFLINGSSQLRAYTTTNGVPTGVAGNPFASGLNDGIDGVLSHNENYFYAANRGQNSLGVYQIAGTGSQTTMTAIAGTPLASGGQFTNALAFNTSGEFLYATNGFSRNITTFNVNPATGAVAVNNIQPANTLGTSGTLSGIVYFEQPTCSTLVTVTADSGPGSLRSAIDCANSKPGLDTVSFAIPGSGVRTITLGSRISVTDPVIIDGTTQGSSPTPLIELSGGNVTSGALQITAGGSTLKGLAINRFTGTAVDFFNGGGNTIQGNFIGTNAAGTMALPNTFHGLRVNSANNLIGGSGPGMGNVLSGNGWDGLQLSNASVNNIIQGNKIGVGIDGVTPIGNSDDGIEALGSNNLIGGTNPGEGNIIAHNGDKGIVLFSSNTSFVGNRFWGNSIHSNGQLGIDLAVNSAGQGVTPNDPGDTDTGPNGLQNFPELTSAVTGASSTTVTGSIDSAPNTTYRIELFSNDSCDPSGHGEGQTFYRTFNITTPANGIGTFDSSSAMLVPVGKFITATATDPSGNTSEFSQCRQVTAATPTPSPTPSPADLVATKTNDLTGSEAWTRQFGTSGNDIAVGIAVDGAGNSFAVGHTSGTFPGEINTGGTDAFVRKYDAEGNIVWTRQFGTSGTDIAYGIGVDAAGNSFAVGYTAGALPGGTSSGGNDAFVRKYDAGGNIVWTRQFGSSGNDIAFAIAVDAAGNSFAAGYTDGTLPGGTNSGGNDAFVRKYDAEGNIVWTRQFGSSGTEIAYGIAVDAAGNSYAAGYTNGTLPGGTSSGGNDAFVRKYDANGNIVWTRQFGTIGTEIALDIGVDAAGNSYAAGYTSGTLPGETSSGSNDAFVRKYDADGNVVWTRQFGSSGIDTPNGIAVDAAGNSYASGSTNGALPGETASGGNDAFVRKYDADGNIVWTKQFGSDGADHARAIAVDGAGNSYAAGNTNGILPGETGSGSDDAFVRKYSGGTSSCAPWTWTITTSNQGAGPAVFAAGQTIVLDELPGSGLTYDTPLVGNFSGITGLGSISASLTGGVLTVTATGALTIEAGGSFIVSFTATPTANGTYDNPRSSGIAMVDPNNVIAESNEANNTFTDSVTVTGCAMEPFVDIAGQVLTSDGRGLRGATVSLTDEQGVKRSVITSSLGFYSFDDVENGTTVVIAVASKRFRFAPRTLEVTASRSDVDFVGIE